MGPRRRRAGAGTLKFKMPLRLALEASESSGPWHPGRAGPGPAVVAAVAAGDRRPTRSRVPVTVFALPPFIAAVEHSTTAASSKMEDS